MTQRPSLQQEGVTHLFWLDYGRVNDLPAVVAQRLIAHRLVCETTAMKGAQVIGRKAQYLTIFQDGIYLIETIRDGREGRFRVPGVRHASIGSRHPPQIGRR